MALLWPCLNANTSFVTEDGIAQLYSLKNLLFLVILQTAVRICSRLYSTHLITSHGFLHFSDWNFLEKVIFHEHSLCIVFPRNKRGRLRSLHLISWCGLRCYTFMLRGEPWPQMWLWYEIQRKVWERLEVGWMQRWYRLWYQLFQNVCGRKRTW